MILSYNWQVLEAMPADEEQLKELVKMPTPEEQQFFSPQSPSCTIQPTALRLPLFGFLFCYYIEEPKSNQPEVQLQAELTMMEEPVSLKVVREIRVKHCIFQQLLIESSQVHDLLLALTVKVKYHPQSKPAKITSINSLVRQVGNRQLNLYSAPTYANIRKQIIVESPVAIEHRRKDGYLLLKLTRTDQSPDQVEIIQVQVMNWLAVGNESLKREVVKGLLSQSFKLKGKETYALPFRIQGSLAGVDVPVAVSYRFPPKGRVFKMVKSIRGESSQ